MLDTRLGEAPGRRGAAFAAAAEPREDRDGLRRQGMRAGLLGPFAEIQCRGPPRACPRARGVRGQLDWRGQHRLHDDWAFGDTMEERSRGFEILLMNPAPRS